MLAFKFIHLITLKKFKTWKQQLTLLKQQQSKATLT